MAMAQSSPPPQRRVLVVGMGSTLRRDDGFGVAVVEALLHSWRPPPPQVTLLDAGSAGITVVQELMSGYEALVLVDAIRRGGQPGTLYLLEPEVQDLASWDDADRRAFLADTHYAVPSKVFVLARALGVLPRFVRVLACEPGDVESAQVGLTTEVAQAVRPAAKQIRALVTTFLDGGSASDGGTTPGALDS